MDAADYGVERAAVRLRRGRRRDLQPALGARGAATCARSATRCRVDTEALAEVEQLLHALAEAEGLPVGAPQAFDAGYLRHQLPGGMVGTMRRQLAEAALVAPRRAVIEELGRVREELGWPIVMTPFAQMLLTQAV